MMRRLSVPLFTLALVAAAGCKSSGSTTSATTAATTSSTTSTGTAAGGAGTGGAGGADGGGGAATTTTSGGTGGAGGATTTTSSGSGGSGGGGACDPAPLTPVTGGGAHAEFTAEAGANNDATPWDATSVSGTFIDASQLTVLTFGDAAGRLFGIQFTSAKPAAGATYQLVVKPPPSDGEAVFTYADGGLTRFWAATGGTLTITDVQGSKISFQICGATMDVDPVQKTNSAAGTFSLTMNGEVDAVTGY
jgi:hypothetical protein